MIKLGIYGLVRVAFDWLGAGPAWWSGMVLVIAAVSAVLGVLYALVEHDLKRLLAYHSVENIGIILLGVGAGMLFQTYHLDKLAALALIAALYHTLNHATFKSLLFMGAGAILQATHTRNMEEMGGLIKRTPMGFMGNIIVLMYLFLLGTFFLALAGLAAGIALIETAVAKPRLFRVPELLSGSFTLALMAVVSFFFVR